MIVSSPADPVAEIARATRDAGAWLHVDGAFGLWAAAVPSRAHLVEGIALADSWATDAHKWLNTPYDSGIAIVRDPHALQAAMAITAGIASGSSLIQPLFSTSSPSPSGFP